MVDHAERLSSEDTAPRDTVVLLGASNLARGVSTVVAAARQACGGPVDVFTALGHGRSYGMDSSLLGRKLPGILPCGIWEALAERRGHRVYALVTDIGNDLLYDVPVPTIVSWVDTCLSRLAAYEARVVLTGLPLDTLNRLSSIRFRLFRTILFPRNGYELGDALRDAGELDRALRELAHRYQAQLVVPRAEWYGIDPIHVKFSAWRRAWPQILSTWGAPTEAFQPVASSLSRWLYLRTRAPAQRTVLGFRQRRKQPSAWLSDGSTVAAY